MAVDAQEMMRRLQMLQSQAGTRPMAGIMTSNADAAREQGGLQQFLMDPLGIGAQRRKVAEGQAMDELNAAQAADQVQRVNDAKAMGAQAAAMGLDRSDPMMAQAYAQMQKGAGGAAGALGGIAASPMFNPQVAQSQSNQQLTDEIQARTDMAKMQSAELEALAAAQDMQPSPFGSNIPDYQTFQAIARPLETSFRAAETVGFMSDVVRNLTPAQISENGALKGELRTMGYKMLPAMQSLSESKDSTLREGERKMIEDFMVNPESFFSGVFSRDPVTLGLLDSLQREFEQKVRSGLVGLDETSMALLNQEALRPMPELSRYKVPEGVPREAQLPTIPTEGISTSERMLLRDQDLR